MGILASTMSADPNKLAQGWRNTTVSPLGSALAVGALTALPAYLAAPYAIRGLENITNRGLSPEEAAESRIETERDMPKIRRRLALAAGLAAGAFPLMHNLNTNEPGLGLTDWTRHTVKEASDTGLAREAFQKYAAMMNPSADNPLYNHPTVPISFATDTIRRDPYMDARLKTQTLNIFGATGEGRTGLISTGDLVRGAVKAGLGFAGGYIAGRALGSLFSLPTNMTNALSATGGIAAALKNTGVF